MSANPSDTAPDPGGDARCHVLVVDDSRLQRRILVSLLKKWGYSVDEAAIREPILRRYDDEGSPYYSTARLWDDGVITTTETRGALALGLAVAANAPVPDPAFGVFRM